MNLSDEELVSALRVFRFKVISHHEHYTSETVPHPVSIPDEDIIAMCASMDRVLLTSDGRMEYVHFSVIKVHPVAIVVVPDNKDKPTKWAEALMKGRGPIERAVRNYKKPFVARINSSGSLFQLKCYNPTNQSPADGAIIIKAGKTDFECARKHRNKAS